MEQKEFIKLLDEITSEFDNSDFQTVFNKYYDTLVAVIYVPILVNHLLETLYCYKVNNKYGV